MNAFTFLNNFLIKTTPAILPLIFMLALAAPSMLLAQDWEETRKFHKKIYQDRTRITHKIKESVNDIRQGMPVSIDGVYVFSTQVLPKFYENRDYKPAWVNFDALMDAMYALEHAYVDGLNPEDYHANVLGDIISKIRLKLNEEVLDYDWVAEFDIMMTDAVLLYAFHLMDGKVDPETLDPSWNYSFRHISADAPYELEIAIETATVSEKLNMMRPQIPGYHMQMELLASYREIAKNGGWKKIPGKEVLKAGMNDERVPLIRMRLLATNHLSTDTNLLSTIYDSLLVEDIKRFQSGNALEADGIIGKSTFEALNVSVEERIDMLRVNMERLRWIVANLSENYILVNIAAFKVYYFENHELKFTSNAQVGKPYTKTPVFKERLRYIEFNPTWTVPVSILRNSLFAKIQDDPAYLNEHGFDLLDSQGNNINPSTIDFGKYSSQNFPFTLRQRPGPSNALGEVKFIFPNKHAVYLHDTPSKSLFARQDRAFSHGCIRTQHPLDLAEVLLKGTIWTKEKIDATIQTRITTRAYPEKEIDVMLMYWTAGYCDGEGIGFFKDVYDRDREVLEKLNSKDMRKPKVQQ